MVNGGIEAREDRGVEQQQKEGVIALSGENGKEGEGMAGGGCWVLTLIGGAHMSHRDSEWHILGHG